jgi:hypothetical protein
VPPGKIFDRVPAPGDPGGAYGEPHQRVAGGAGVSSHAPVRAQLHGDKAVVLPPVLDSGKIE